MKVRAGWALILAGIGLGQPQIGNSAECGAWVDKAYVLNRYHATFGFAPEVTFFVKIDREALAIAEVSRVFFRGVKIHRNDQSGVVGPVMPYEVELQPFVGSMNYFETTFYDIQPAFWKNYQYSTYEGRFYVEGSSGERF